MNFPWSVPPSMKRRWKIIRKYAFLSQCFLLHTYNISSSYQEVDHTFQSADSKSSNYPDPKKSGVTGWFRKFSKKERSEKRSTEPEGESFNEIKESGEFIESSYEMESSGDLR